MKQYVYSDPTGGGDDMTLTVPDWIVEPPQRINGWDMNREYHTFELVED